MSDGLRERKKRETRLALAREAVRLAVERGWGNVTVADIAEAADVSERTFRNHFTGKADAIAHVHLERFRRIAATLAGRPADEPLWCAVGAAVLEGFALDAANTGDRPAEHTEQRPPDRDAGRRWLDGVRLMTAEPALGTEVARVSALGQDELAVVVATRTGTDAATGTYPHLVAAAVGSAVSVALRCWLRDPAARSLPDLLSEAVEGFATGLPEPRRGKR